MADLATAYLRLVPSLKGSKRAIEDELAGVDGSRAGERVGESMGEGIGGKLGSAGPAIGRALGAAVLAGAAVGLAGIGAIVKQSLDSYAEYEQLAGGVEKLYGESADIIMNYAQQAYATAGMSANQYMEQATSFSAALVSSLGGDTAAAAEMTDVAMRAMADNVNVFGSNMEDVQNAFQGFAKQNYTMLDNLNNMGALAA